MSVKSALNGSGLASGFVQQGDVGARSQRFVTVIGDVVRRSWALCEEACVFVAHHTVSFGVNAEESRLSAFFAML